MNIIEGLFSQYSIETLILLIIGVALSVKFIGELWEYFYNKIRLYFNYKNQKDQAHDEIINGIIKIETRTGELQETVEALTENIRTLQKQSELATKRLQENSRSYIIDKHHYFCYQVKAIDDLNLQSLERRYLYYKAEGGDTFVDGLMDEVRALPRVSLHDHKILETVQCERGEKNE